MAKSLTDSDAMPFPASIKTPTLLLWGDGDRRSPLSVAEQIHAAMPHSRLTVIAGAGHVSNMEKSRDINANVRRLLSQRIDRRPTDDIS